MQSSKDISHVLLMDDDAVIQPHSLEVNYVFLSLLKEEYKDYVMAGSIMRIDEPNVQYELGARWNRGNIVAQRHYLDMRKLKNLLLNEEEEEPAEYTGWWYTCYPLSTLDKNNLPLPLFIHRDDVEYGMRIGNGKFIFMNGLCVWHEAFENKMQGPLEYYDIWNLAIVNAIHHPDYGPREFKKIFTRWVINNIVRYRYNYVDMNFRAVEDFCNGMDWFIQQEAEPLHKEIAAMNYKGQKKEEFYGYKGVKESDFDLESPFRSGAAGRCEKSEKIFPDPDAERLFPAGEKRQGSGDAALQQHVQDVPGSRGDLHRCQRKLHPDEAEWQKDDFLLHRPVQDVAVYR